MATYVKFQDFIEQLALGIHDWDTHVFKLALTNTLPVNTQTDFDPVTNHAAPAAANGYTARGETTTIGVSEASGTVTVTGTQCVYTATAGGIGPFQYAVLYNESATNDKLVAYWDYGSSITLNNGESFTAKFNNASPGNIFTAA